MNSCVSVNFESMSVNSKAYWPTALTNEGISPDTLKKGPGKTEHWTLLHKGSKSRGEEGELSTH